MNAKKKKLGRGLDALLGDITSPKSTDTQTQDSNESVSKRQGDRLAQIPIEKLQRGVYQPRSHMDEDSLHELAHSIQSQGILQPILVRPVESDQDGEQYEIIAGERRWRASQIAQLDVVPVIIRDIPDEATLAVALIENIQRENLNPIEEAVGLHRLMEEFELTHQQVADHVGRSRSAVSNLLRLLALEPRVKEMLFQRKLEMGHARALLALPEEQQFTVAQTVESKRLSVRQTEELIKKTNNPAIKAETKKVDSDIRHLEDTLSDRLQAEVKIQDNKGKGKLIISYSSLNVLDGILDKIK
jgi:ParB family chromosome partitioning protein